MNNDSSISPTLTPTFIDENEDELRPVDIFLQAFFPFLTFAFVAMMTASVDRKLLIVKFYNRGILIGLFIQFIVSPLIGFITVKIPFFGDNLSAADKVTLLAILSSPGGTFSNILCSLFNADLALSVTMSAVSTLASAVFLPFNLFLYVTVGLSSEELGDVRINFFELSYTIVAVELGTVFGILLGRKFNEEKHQNMFNLIGIILSALILVVSTSLSQSEEKLTEKSFGFVFTCLFPVILLASLGILLSTLAKVEKPERLSVAVESSYQNTAIAISVAFATFELDDARSAVNVSIANGLGQFFVSMTVLFIGYKAGWTYVPEDMSFCKSIVKNCQPKSSEEEENILEATSDKKELESVEIDEDTSDTL